MKVLLILVDGMRPDALTNVEAAQRILRKSLHSMNAQTVIPSVTLPCHVSLFHSVDPERHGTTTNTYMPQVRPIKGLCEVIRANKKRSAFFYNWEELRDLSRPGSLSYAYFCRGGEIGYAQANNMVTDAAIDHLQKDPVDFAFLYMGYPDAAGHAHGWMSEQYHKAIANSWANIERAVEALGDAYTVIITADHGGHNRTHGTELPEDMTIPIMILGNSIPEGEELGMANIKDIAPTITTLLDIEADEEWEGSSLLNK